MRVQRHRDSRLHVVFGIPGTGIRRSLARFATAHDHVDVVSLEEELERIAAPHVQKLYETTPSKLAVFALPRHLLKDLWSQALKTQWKSVTASLRKSRDVIFTCHLCYFHHLSREYLTVANLQELTAHLQSSKHTSLVTFIDDIYDCCRRLCAADGVFSLPRTPEEAILDALSVLDWRQMEILLADAIATASKRRHYLFAVKHPSATLHDLLYTGKPTAYLSHPISEPRRMWTKGKLPKAEVHNIVAEVREITERLSAKFVVIQPTAIDEFRYDRGRLTTRWPFTPPTSDAIYAKPGVVNSPLMFPAGWDEDHRTEIADGPILRRLQETIYRQIGARDYYLLEQADTTICYRPIYRGNASGGVETELKHYANLTTYKPRDPALVYAPKSDREQYASRQLWEQIIPAWVDRRLINGTEADIAQLIGDCEDGRLPERDQILNGDATALQAALHRYNITITPKEDKHLPPKGAMGTTDALLREMLSKELAREMTTFRHLYLDELKRDGAIKIYTDLRTIYKELDIN